MDTVKNIVEKRVQPEIEIMPMEEEDSSDDEFESAGYLDDDSWVDLSLVRRGSLYKGC